MSIRTEGSTILQRLRDDFPELAQVPAGVFAVGGAVRDALLGKSSPDVDLACHDAERIARAFCDRVSGGFAELGERGAATFRVVVDGRIYDFNEIIGETIQQDLGRRDFTINAIALDLGSSSLLDPYGGVADLERRRLRMVDEQNFREDPLRVLRGVRMAVALDLTIERDTLAAMHRHARSIETVAAERVGYELDLIFASSERARGLALLNQLELDAKIFGFVPGPELVEAIALIAGTDPTAGYATLFFERGEAELKRFAKRWRWSGRQLRETAAAMEIARLARTIAHGELPMLIYDFGLDTARRAVQILYAFEFDQEADALSEVIESRGERIASTTPLLEGERIQLEAGVEEGPEVGRMKRAVLEAQLRGEITTREQAIGLIKRLGSPDR